MNNFVILVILAHIGMAAIDLPSLWRSRQQRRAFWVTVALLLLGLILAIPITMRQIPPSVLTLIEGLFKPIGTRLFQTKVG